MEVAKMITFKSIMNRRIPTTITTTSELLSAQSFSNKVVKFGFIEHDDHVTNIDKENISFANAPLVNGCLAEEISNKQYFKPISNQASLSSCVANATADATEAEQARSKGISPSSVPDISRLFIYWNSRNNQNPPAYDKDDGSYIALAFDVIRRYGVAPEDYWPYDINQVLVRPSPLAYARGYAVRINNYFSINSTGDDRVADVIRTLSSGRCVVFGTKLDDQFPKIRGAQIITPPTGNYIGNHCMIISGWSASKNAFEIRNSWGEGWGDLGYTYFTPEYIKASFTKDLFVATL